MLSSGQSWFGAAIAVHEPSLCFSTMTSFGMSESKYRRCVLMHRPQPGCSAIAFDPLDMYGKTTYTIRSIKERHVDPGIHPNGTR